jgi:hypothetical protein
LYDTADPVSVMWAKLWLEARPRKFISRSDAQRALAAEETGETGGVPALR